MTTTRRAEQPPDYRLVPRAEAPVAVPRLDEAQQQVVDHDAGALLVLAGPGTGKTTTLVEAAVARVQRGVAVENLLLLTFGRRAAGELRDRVTARLGRTVREPVARTVHSYAFGLLRMAASRDGLPAPRLLSGAEQDVLLRDLIEGDVLDRRTPWPAPLQPALHTRGFAAEVRDLMMRASERGLSDDGLRDLAVHAGRPDWDAVGRFWRQYAGVTALQRPGAYDAAELIRAAIDALHADPELLARERSRRRRIFLDEYQDTDPAQAELLALLADGADELVLVGDPDQSIYGFRGADPHAMAAAADRFGDDGRLPTVALRTSRRSGARLLAAGRRVAERLPGPAAHRRLETVPGTPPGDVEVRLLRTASEEAATVATELRRAHLDRGVPWHRMAVLVRSTVISLATIRRALLTAGVPVAVAGEDTPMSEQSAVAHLLLFLRCAAEPDAVTDEDVETLLLGPTGGADALYLRRLRRAVRAQTAIGDQNHAIEGEPLLEVDPPADLLVPLLQEPAALALLPARLAAPLRRVVGVIAAGRLAVTADAAASAEDVLWAVWEATGLAAAWAAASARGGLAGAAADRDLDAVLELFDAAARLADRLPGATVGSLIEHVTAQQVPADALSADAVPGGAVQVLTAHAAKGLEWDVVCVAGVQEGVWPSLRRRGSLLGVETLVDLAAGIAAPAGDPDHDPVAAAAALEPQLAEERRLFYVAITRGRRRLLVTAVSGEEEQPSRFLDELDPVVDERPVLPPPRGLHLTELVAELRAEVCDPGRPEHTRQAAAGELARLAADGVPGADPDRWWGLPELSDERGLLDDDQPAVISPSAIEAYLTCALKTLLESNGGRQDQTAAASLGSAVHEIAEVAAAGADLEQLEAELDQRWGALDFGAAWYARVKREQASAMLGRLHRWLGEERTGLELVGAEQRFRVALGELGGGPAVLGGAVDRLERDAEGRAVVIDIKTGKTKPAATEVPVHPQLLAYQFAVEHGAFAEQVGERPGGARLVQLGSTGKLEQDQAPISDQSREVIREQLARVAAVLRGARFDAVINVRCGNCPVRRACPATDGAQVTQ